MARSRYFEDLSVGLCETSPARTIHEEDILEFARISGDHNPLHIDRAHAASTSFGRPIAHGLLGVALASGLFTRTELSSSLQRALVALLHIDWSFRAPVFPGDAIRVEATVSALRETSRSDRGVAIVHRRVLNQHDACVQEGHTTLLVRRRGNLDPTTQAG